MCRSCSTKVSFQRRENIYEPQKTTYVVMDFFTWRVQFLCSTYRVFNVFNSTSDIFNFVSLCRSFILKSFSSDLYVCTSGFGFRLDRSVFSSFNFVLVVVLLRYHSSLFEQEPELRNWKTEKKIEKLITIIKAIKQIPLYN